MSKFFRFPCLGFSLVLVALKVGAQNVYVTSVEVKNSPRIARRLSFVVIPQKIKLTGKGINRCTPLTKNHRIELLFSDQPERFSGIELELGGTKRLSAMSEKEGVFKAIYAEDSDSGSDSTTLEYQGTFSNGQLSNGLASIKILTGAKSCSLNFRF